MSKLSRRALVATAATLPAFSVPAIAADAFGPDYPDAELLRLGTDLEKIELEWVAQQRIDRQHDAARDAALEAAGLPYKRLSEFESREQWNVYHAKRAAVWYEGKAEEDADVGEQGELIAWEDIHSRLGPIIRATEEHKPRTLAGLAVLTRAMALSWNEGDVPPEEWQPYIEAVSDLVGIKCAPAVLQGEA